MSPNDCYPCLRSIHSHGERDEHEAKLRQISAKTGVPAEIITAILGVETFYGTRTGSFRAVDALATLAFDYPPRSAFFRSELRELLVMFRAHAPNRMANIRTALREKDVKALKAAAHALCGSAAYVYARPVTDIAKRMEELASENRIIEAAVFLPELETAFAAAEAALKELEARVAR